MEHTDVQLKPCPFCGGDAYVGQDFHSRGPDKWIATCLAANNCALLVETEPKPTRADAVAAWNRRLGGDQVGQSFVAWLRKDADETGCTMLNEIADYIESR